MSRIILPISAPSSSRNTKECLSNVAIFFETGNALTWYRIHSKNSMPLSVFCSDVSHTGLARNCFHRRCLRWFLLSHRVASCLQWGLRIIFSLQHNLLCLPWTAEVLHIWEDPTRASLVRKISGIVSELVDVLVEFCVSFPKDCVTYLSHPFESLVLVCSRQIVVIAKLSNNMDGFGYKCFSDWDCHRKSTFSRNFCYSLKRSGRRWVTTRSPIAPTTSRVRGCTDLVMSLKDNSISQSSLPYWIFCTWSYQIWYSVVNGFLTHFQYRPHKQFKTAWNRYRSE